LFAGLQVFVWKTFMCGIVGYLDKQRGQERPLGQTLLAMLQALSCRGPDSAGVALFGSPETWHLRVGAPANFDSDSVRSGLREAGVAVFCDYQNGVYDGMLSSGTDAASVEEKIAHHLPGTEVICLGRQLNLFKQVGSPTQLEATYGIGARPGTHGIGHTRLSTESRVDLSHSQPFWAHGVPDLATVHNGHITNYHKLRRRYEQRVYRFYTENDSEVIGVYLRDRLAAGLTLADAMRSSLDDFDGSFSYLVANGNTMGYVRDRYGFKPLMIAETANFVAIATEEVALRQALGTNFGACELAPGSLRLWDVQQVPSARC
jgi:glutamate synthase domain-containing protein 1